MFKRLKTLWALSSLDVTEPQTRDTLQSFKKLLHMRKMATIIEPISSLERDFPNNE